MITEAYDRHQIENAQCPAREEGVGTQEGALQTVILLCAFVVSFHRQPSTLMGNRQSPQLHPLDPVQLHRLKHEAGTPPKTRNSGLDTDVTGRVTAVSHTCLQVPDTNSPPCSWKTNTK